MEQVIGKQKSRDDAQDNCCILLIILHLSFLLSSGSLIVKQSFLPAGRARGVIRGAQPAWSVWSVVLH
jgi:hypothetical protein